MSKQNYIDKVYTLGEDVSVEELRDIAQKLSQNEVHILMKTALKLNWNHAQIKNVACIAAIQSTIAKGTHELNILNVKLKDIQIEDDNFNELLPGSTEAILNSEPDRELPIVEHTVSIHGHDNITVNSNLPEKITFKECDMFFTSLKEKLRINSNFLNIYNESSNGLGVYWESKIIDNTNNSENMELFSSFFKSDTSCSLSY